MADLVIGSGPAGVSVARARLARGYDVEMLDAGAEPEPGLAARMRKMAEKPPEDWSSAERLAWMSPQFSAPEGEVRRYGTGFAMEPAAHTFAAGSEWFALRASRAAGGLSNIWGAAVLPYRQEDIADWPVTAEDLAPHYKASAEIMPVSGQQDDLAGIFPAFDMADTCAIPPTAQAEMLLSRLSRKATALARMGVYAGMARQAVDASCRRCGLCLHGCPWSLIYSARQTRDTLLSHPNFKYHSNAAVRQVREDCDGVSITLADGRRFRGDRVFIAAGVLESARILLASVGLAGEELTLKDSHQAFLPLLHLWSGPRRPDVLPFQTLPQLFLELDDETVSPHLVHAQIYTWNEYFARDLKRNYGRRIPGAGIALEALARRLIVAQVFLHSDSSPAVGLRLAADGRLIPCLRDNPITGSAMPRALDRFSRALRLAGLAGMRFAARQGAPGASFHMGGTLPMKSNPGRGDSDILGRPKGALRIHVADASVFPSVPATTITFSVMANAHRIGTTAP